MKHSPIRRTIVLGLALLGLLALAGSAVRAQAGPSVVKSSILIGCRRHTSFYKTPSGPQDETLWSWTPRIKFRVNGPIAAGTLFTTDFTMPGGKPWLTITMGTTEEVPADGWWQYDMAGNDLEAPQGVNLAGEFGFKINMANELNGTKGTVYTGKFKVDRFKVYPDNPLPKFKNIYEHFVDQDWNLPIGYLLTRTWTTQYGRQVADTPRLQAVLWFRGEGKDPEAYIFHGGKQIDKALSVSEMDISTFETSTHNSWQRLRFIFNKVLPHAVSGYSVEGMTFLDQNPGDYEIKVLRNGKLCRTATFSVGPDGNPVDNGIGERNHVGDGRIILPVKVVGDTEGKVDLLAWKTGAFYGNPLEGFSAP